MSSLNGLYEQIIEELKASKRPQITITPELTNEIIKHWDDFLEGDKKVLEHLHKALCILDNSKTTLPDFDKHLENTLLCTEDPQTLVFALGAIQNQIISRCSRSGDRIAFSLIQALKKTLEHPDPEVLEWSLRTIEQLGTQGLLLKTEIFARKPGIFASFNRHAKASKQIIEMLEKRWTDPRDQK